MPRPLSYEYAAAGADSLNRIAGDVADERRFRYTIERNAEQDKRQAERDAQTDLRYEAQDKRQVAMDDLAIDREERLAKSAMTLDKLRELELRKKGVQDDNALALKAEIAKEAMEANEALRGIRTDDLDAQEKLADWRVKYFRVLDPEIGDKRVQKQYDINERFVNQVTIERMRRDDQIKVATEKKNLGVSGEYDKYYARRAGGLQADRDVGLSPEEKALYKEAEERAKVKGRTLTPEEFEEVKNRRAQMETVIGTARQDVRAGGEDQRVREYERKATVGAEVKKQFAPTLEEDILKTYLGAEARAAGARAGGPTDKEKAALYEVNRRTDQRIKDEGLEGRIDEVKRREIAIGEAKALGAPARIDEALKKAAAIAAETGKKAYVPDSYKKFNDDLKEAKEAYEPSGGKLPDWLQKAFEDRGQKIEEIEKNKGIPGIDIRGTAPTPTASTPSIPKAGDERSGYRFKGGNPADRANWEKL